MFQSILGILGPPTSRGAMAGEQALELNTTEDKGISYHTQQQPWVGLEGDLVPWETIRLPMVVFRVQPTDLTSKYNIFW